MPLPYTLQVSFFKLTLMPNFFIALIVAITSCDINKFLAVDTPLAKDENRSHLILILLSPLTCIILSKDLIFLFKVMFVAF